jgi:stage II sporulation protein D
MSAAPVRGALAVLAMVFMVGIGRPSIAVRTLSAPPVAAQGAGAPVIPTAIRIGMTHGSSYDVTVMPLEAYVASVLAGEAAASSPPAALEALAIAVRTFALANLNRHGRDGFDLCDQTHCQVLRPATPATDRAAQATAGRVLMYRNALASVFFSASCGGFTERPSSVWPGADDPPYLPSQKDDACEGEPRWAEDLSRSDLTRALASAGFRGTLRDVHVVTRDGSGRVARLGLDGLTPDEISGQDLRTAVIRTFGGQHLKSAAFEVRRTGDVYHFTGHGYGHGVGMCVIGSVKLAAGGETAEEILSRYYPGTAIVGPAARTTRAPAPVPAPPLAAAFMVTVSLPTGDDGDEGVVAALAARERDAAAAALGVAPPPITLRFHATTEDYERSTRAPWFTSAAIVDGEIHLVPLASLRDRGILERTIRREVVHVIVDTALDRRPAWVREGAALYFSDGSRDNSTTQARVPCPSDVELLAPTSPGALADAYGRARSCFARQAAGGRSWRDVR